MFLIILVSLLILYFPFYIAHAEAPTAPTKAVEESKPLIPILERIAFCESKNDPLAKNKFSSASGRFQFLSGSWRYYGKQLWGDRWIEKNVFDYDDNTDLAYFTFKLDNVRPWLSSKNCWK